MKNWVAFLLIAIGTGFGQELKMPTSDARCYMAVTSKDAAKSMVEIPCPTSGAGKVSAIHKEPEPVDVPAIQERYKGPKNCGAMTSPGENTGWLGSEEHHGRLKDGGEWYSWCQTQPPLEWTCKDENRVLLTSVNGKRHSCHLIPEDK